MSNFSKSVFISYRREPSWTVARLLFTNLVQNGFDVFMDVETIDSGKFDTIILNQIAARMHFILILSPGTVERFEEPDDWLRREIEHAIDLERNIVPVLANGFAFDKATVEGLTGKLQDLPRYNAISVQHDFFDATVQSLRVRFLKDQPHVVAFPTPVDEQPIVARKIEIAADQPEPTFEELFEQRFQELRVQLASRLGTIEHRLERLEQFEEKTARRMDDFFAHTEQQIQRLREQIDRSKHVVSLQMVAEQQARTHNLKAAIEILKKAHEVDPENHATNFLLGLLLATQRHIDLAIIYLEKSIQIEPGFAPAIACLGLALRRKGDRSAEHSSLSERNELWAEAESKLLEALEMDPELTDTDGESYFAALGGLYRRQKRYDAAINAYQRAYQVTPDSSFPIINLANLLKHSGNDDEAERFFALLVEKATLTLDDNPRDVWTRADFAQAQLVLGNSEKALAELKTIVTTERDPEVLETIRSGLIFLKQSPSPIEGLDHMIQIIEDKLISEETGGIEKI